MGSLRLNLAWFGRVTDYSRHHSCNEKIMPAANEREFSIEVIQKLRDAGHEALWAGGCVRDLLLEREAGDFDVATSARPEEVRELFKRTLNVGAAFGVIIVLGKKSQGQIEVATFRADGEYLDGRRPNEVTFCSAEQDALRRDFTINGMFYEPIAKNVIDYVGGKQDLEAEVIRAIGNARDRFEEDKLRLLRAVRFAARLNFALEPETAAAVREMAVQINVVSAERIAEEMRKMLRHPHRAIAMQLCRDHELLNNVFPELASASDEQWAVVHGVIGRLEPSASFEVAMASLLSSLGKKAVSEICRRLKLANKESDAIVWLVEYINALSNASEFSLAKLKRLLAKPLVRELIALVTARDEVSDKVDSAFCCDYLANTPADVIDPTPLLTGDDLIANGFKPGPKFKSLLDSVRDAQLNGEITSFEAALELAKQL